MGATERGFRDPSAIEARWRAYLSGDGRLTISLPCGSCGYDLHLAPLDGRCPECGTRVASSLASDDLLVLPPEQARRLGDALGLLTSGTLWAVVLPMALGVQVSLNTLRVWKGGGVLSLTGLISVMLTGLAVAGCVRALAGAARLATVQGFRYQRLLRRRTLAASIGTIVLVVLTALTGIDREWIYPASLAAFTAMLLPAARYLRYLCARLGRPQWGFSATGARLALSISMAAWLITAMIWLLQPPARTWLTGMRGLATLPGLVAPAVAVAASVTAMSLLAACGLALRRRLRELCTKAGDPGDQPLPAAPGFSSACGSDRSASADT